MRTISLTLLLVVAASALLSGCDADEEADGKPGNVRFTIRRAHGDS